MALNRPPVLPVWADTGDKTQPSDAEIAVGWPVTSIPPSRQRFNWFQNFAANGIRYFSRRGVSDWASTEAYEVGDRCIGDDGKTYKAILANINFAPSTNPLKWERWGFTSAELDAYMAGFLPYGAPPTCPNTGPIGTDNKAKIYKSALGEYWMWLGDAWKVIAGHYRASAGIQSFASNGQTAMISITAPRTGMAYISGVTNSLNNSNTLVVASSNMWVNGVVVQDSLVTGATQATGQQLILRPIARRIVNQGDVVLTVLTTSATMGAAPAGNNNEAHITYLD